MKKVSFFFFFISFLAGIIWLFLTNNIHSVIPRQVYRSAQLTPGSLSYLIDREGIKTVINLRGKSYDDWYKDEIAVINKIGIKHYDLALGAHQVISVTDLKQLVKLLETAPRPILVHCQGGADRTGLTSALVLMLDQNQDLKIAKQQFSFHYLVFSSTSTAKLTLPYYQKWLAQHQLKSNRSNLLTWINQLQPGVNYPSN